MELAIATNDLTAGVFDRAHYDMMRVRLRQMKTRFARRRKTIADSHALFDRVRTGPIGSRQHWVRCKLHWFTEPESARLYQAEVELKRRFGDRPGAPKKGWRTALHDETQTKYHVDFDSDVQSLSNDRILHALPDDLSEAEMAEHFEKQWDAEQEAFHIVTNRNHAIRLPGSKDGSDIRFIENAPDSVVIDRSYDTSSPFLLASDLSDKTTSDTGADFTSADKRLWLVPADMDDKTVANAYAVVKSIENACQDGESSGTEECAVSASSMSEAGVSGTTT